MRQRWEEVRRAERKPLLPYFQSVLNRLNTVIDLTLKRDLKRLETLQKVLEMKKRRA